MPRHIPSIVKALDGLSSTITTQDSYIVDTVGYSTKWLVRNVKQFGLDPFKPHRSPVFPTDSLAKHKWQILMYYAGDHNSDGDNVSVGITLDTLAGDVASPVVARVKISIINNTNQETNTTTWLAELKSIASESVNSYFIHRETLHDYKYGMLSGDDLTLTCEIRVYTDLLIDSPKKTFQLANDFGGIFESELLSDVEIVTAGRDFKAHKAILAARSPVFRAMFIHDMKESQLGRVKIDDVEPRIFEQLLRYIYTGNTNLLVNNTFERGNKESANESSFAIDLLRAACKYQLDDLKLTCEHHIYKHLSVESIVEILSMVDTYQASWLKSRALDFAISHAKELTRNGVWKELVKHCPEILADILAKQWPATPPASTSKN